MDALTGSNWASERYVEPTSSQSFLQGGRALQPLSYANIRDPLEMEPTSERIVEDIQSLKRTLEMIVQYKGCLVPDMDMRSGRRQAKLNGNGLCKGKARKSQRIATLRERPTHPTALRALDLIDKEAVDEFERLDVARLHHELLAFVADDDDDDEGSDGGGEAGDGDESDDTRALNMDSDEETVQGDDEDEKGGEGSDQG